MKTGKRLSVRSFFSAFVLIAMGNMLAGCKLFSDVDQILSSEKMLPGARKSVFPDKNEPYAFKTSSVPPVIPAVRPVTDWPQPGGNAAHAPGHLELVRFPERMTRIGLVRVLFEGVRASSSPIIHRNRVFVMDASTNLVSFSIFGGDVESFSLRPDGEPEKAVPGGGVSVEKGILYAATGYGDLHAFDLSGGRLMWKVALGSAIRSAPAVAGGKVFVVTRDDRVIAFNENGDFSWEYRGNKAENGVLSAPSPAVFGNFVVVPNSSGEIIAFKTSSGKPIWSEAFLHARRFTSLAGISDVAAPPVIDDGVVYAVSVSGHMSSISLQTGKRLWRRPVFGSQMPLSAGKVVYVVDLEGKLVAFSRKNGDMHWMTELPGDATAYWSGPILASGALWLVSSDGLLLGIDAISGRIVSQIEIGEPVYTAPVIAGGHIYLLTGRGAVLRFD